MEDPQPTPDDAPDEAPPVREHRCGRCQQMFPVDPDQHATAQLGWWLCPPCHQSLLGTQRVSRP